MRRLTNLCALVWALIAPVALPGCDRPFLASSSFASDDDAPSDGTGLGDAATDAGVDSAEVEPTQDAEDVADTTPDADATDSDAAEDAEVADGADVAPDDVDAADANPGDTADSADGADATYPACDGGKTLFLAAPGDLVQFDLLALAPGPDGGQWSAGTRPKGKLGGTDAALVRIDATGDIAWSMAYGGSGDDGARAVASLAGGGALLVGYRDAGTTAASGLWIRTDNAGASILDAKHAGADWWAVVDRGDLGSLVCGAAVSTDAGSQGAIASLDAAGGVTWQWLGGGAKDDRLEALVVAKDHVVAAGSRDALTAGWLAAVSDKGQPLWQRTFDAASGGTIQLHGLSRTGSGDLIAVGAATANGQAAQGLVVWADPTGAQRWRQSASGAADVVLRAVTTRLAGDGVALGTIGAAAARKPLLVSFDRWGVKVETKEPSTPPGSKDVTATALVRGAADDLWWSGAFTGDQDPVAHGYVVHADPWGAMTCTASGACAGLANACDDGNPCTKDLCSPSGGCTSLPVSLPCDDGKPCTTGEACAAGACSGGGATLSAVTGTSTETQALHAATLASGGGVWTVGLSQKNVVQRALIERRGSDGQVLASAVRGNPGTRVANAVVALGDGSVVVVGTGFDTVAQGNEVWVERDGPELGEPMWQATLGGGGDQVGLGGALHADGAVWVVGSSGASGKSQAWVGHFSVGGAVLGSSAFGDGADQGLAAAVANGGVLAACGHRVAVGKSASDAWLVRWDAAGKQVGSSQHGEGANHRCEALRPLGTGWLLAGHQDNNTVGGSAGWMHAIDAAGKELWTQATGSSGVNGFAAVEVMADGRIFGAGSVTDDGSTVPTAWLFRVSPTGAYIEETYPGGEGADGIAATLRGPDDSLIFVGHRVGSGAGSATWFERRDPWANETCGAGSCFSTTFKACDDANPCTFDACDPNAGCKHSTFNDGTWCDGGACHAGSCLAVPNGKLYIAKGSFWMGADGKGAAVGPAHLVTLKGLLIDEREVTVDDYDACVQAKACTAPKTYSPGPSALYNYGRPGAGQHPVNGVTWQQAVDACTFRKGRLPTEAEWEYVARGTCPDPADLPGCKAQMRTYPWGEDTPSCSYAVIASTGGTTSGDGCGVGTTAPVGSKPDGSSPFGALDMIGNVWEWVADWYTTDGYPAGAATDPTGAATGTSRARRGGAFADISGQNEGKQAWNRAGSPPTATLHTIGFRCAYDLP